MGYIIRSTIASCHGRRIDLIRRMRVARRRRQALQVKVLRGSVAGACGPRIVAPLEVFDEGVVKRRVRYDARAEHLDGRPLDKARASAGGKKTIMKKSKADGILPWIAPLVKPHGPG